MTSRKPFTDDELFEMQMGRPKNAQERDMDESLRLYGGRQCFVCGFSQDTPTHDASLCAKIWQEWEATPEDER